MHYNIDFIIAVIKLFVTLYLNFKLFFPYSEYKFTGIKNTKLRLINSVTNLFMECDMCCSDNFFCV